MSRDLQQAQSPPNLLRELIDGWKYVLTRPGKDTYSTQLAKAGLLKTTLGVGLSGIVASLYALAAGDISPIPEPMNIVLNLFTIILLAEAIFFIVNLLLYFTLTAMGGSGFFVE